MCKKLFGRRVRDDVYRDEAHRGYVWLSAFIAYFVCLTGEAVAQDAAATLDRIPVAMQAFVDKSQISGAVALVSDEDRTLHHSAVGFADVAAKRAMARDSIFRIASMTKPITSTALMQLVAQGKLKLDHPVSEYIPSYAGLKLKEGQAAREITVQDVMTHTSGVAGSAGGVDGDSLAGVVESYAKQPLAFPPGEKWSYSSGVTIGGRLIEIASGEDYEAYLAKHIFEPLDMADTTFTLTAEQAGRLAQMYKPGSSPGTLDIATTPNPTVRRTPSPSGGLFSTAEDMAKFYRAVLHDVTLPEADSPRLLATEYAKQMLKPRTGDLETGFTPGNAWGVGWCIVQKPQGVTARHSVGTFGHGGAWGTQGWVDPAKKRIVILMIQRTGFGNSDASGIRATLNELALP